MPPSATQPDKSRYAHGLVVVEQVLAVGGVRDAGVWPQAHCSPRRRPAAAALAGSRSAGRPTDSLPRLRIVVTAARAITSLVVVAIGTTAHARSGHQRGGQQHAGDERMHP